MCLIVNTKAGLCVLFAVFMAAVVLALAYLADVTLPVVLQPNI